MISAALSSPQFGQLIETLPDYSLYDTSDAYDLEPRYRLAVGRVLKSCGDRLLDAAEIQRRFLTPTQSRVIDALLATISDILHHLNCSGEIYTDAEDPQWIEGLLHIDGQLLSHLEKLVCISARVRRDDMTASWLSGSGASYYRTLRRLRRTTEQRNNFLGLTLFDDPFEVEVEDFASPTTPEEGA